jgi:hypothetical protein
VAGPREMKVSAPDSRVLEDSRGRLWLSLKEEVCHADASEVASLAPGAMGPARRPKEPDGSPAWPRSPREFYGPRLSRRASIASWTAGAGSPSPARGRCRRGSSGESGPPLPGADGWISYGTILRALDRPDSAEAGRWWSAPPPGKA